MAQPSTVSSLIDSAVDAGATTLKPVEKSMWGYGGSVQAPDGTIWKVATSAKKDTGAATRQVDKIVLLLGVEDVAASKRFYVDRGLAVGKSFGSYVDFALPSSPVGLGSTSAVRSPRTPVSLSRAVGRTGCSSTAAPSGSPTPPGSRGRPHR